MRLTDRGEAVVKWLLLAAVAAGIFVVVLLDKRMTENAYSSCIDRGVSESSCETGMYP